MCTVFTLIFGVVLSYIVYFVSCKNQMQNIITYDNIYNLVKLLLILTLGISFIFFIFFLYFFYIFFNHMGGYSVFSTYCVLPKTQINNSIDFFEASIDIFGIFLLFLAYFVGILSLLALDNRLFWKNIKYLFTVNIFIIIVFFYVFSTNMLVFFLFYELLLIPSFLVVYFISPSRRAVQASMYFLI